MNLRLFTPEDRAVQPALPGMPLPVYVPDADPDSSSDELFTPRWVIDLIPGVIDLDPFSPPQRPVPARKHYILSEGHDAYAESWDVGPDGIIYVNGPYSQGHQPRWVQLCREAFEQVRARVVIALPQARPNSAYWHRNVWGHAEVGFFSGRITFDSVAGATKGVGMFDSAMLVWTRDWRFMDALKKRTETVGVRWVR